MTIISKKASAHDHFARWGWRYALIAVKFCLQMIAVDNYGFHRDEYLYLAQSEHLAWGYRTTRRCADDVANFG